MPLILWYHWIAISPRFPCFLYTTTKLTNACLLHAANSSLPSCFTLMITIILYVLQRRVQWRFHWLKRAYCVTLYWYSMVWTHPSSVPVLHVPSHFSSFSFFLGLLSYLYSYHPYYYSYSPRPLHSYCYYHIFFTLFSSHLILLLLLLFILLLLLLILPQYLLFPQTFDPACIHHRTCESATVHLLTHFYRYIQQCSRDSCPLFLRLMFP